MERNGRLVVGISPQSLPGKAIATFALMTIKWASRRLEISKFETAIVGTLISRPGFPFRQLPSTWRRTEATKQMSFWCSLFAIGSGEFSCARVQHRCASYCSTSTLGAKCGLRWPVVGCWLCNLGHSIFAQFWFANLVLIECTQSHSKPHSSQCHIRDKIAPIRRGRAHCQESISVQALFSSTTCLFSSEAKPMIPLKSTTDHR